MSLTDVVADPARRESLVSDGMRELEAEVNNLSGLKGKATKAGYKTVQKVRPGFIEQNVDRLLPAFAPTLDPHYEAGKTAGDVEGHFVKNADTIAGDLLSVTDKRAAEASNAAAVKVYEKLRGAAEGQVVAAMPRVGALAARHGG